MLPFPRIGLYAVTPEHQQGKTLIDAVGQALDGGAVAVQYRDKSESVTQRCADASKLVELCHRHGAPLIINDDIQLAASVKADGVHIGRNDGSLKEARKQLGTTAIVGVSCYDDPQRALEAQANGASYVAFGSFFPSLSKPGAVRATPQLVADIREQISLPIVGIGGITVENAAALLTAGVDSLAVINAVFGYEDPTSSATAFSNLFT